MQVITGPPLQQPWARFLSQALDFGKTISEKLDWASDFIADQVEIKTCMKNAKAPVIVPLVADTPQAPKITADTKMLIIGDSQTVGAYGRTLDSLARGTGAAVVTHASWGASPHWFITGQATNYKYWSRDAAGQESSQMHVKTPLLKDLLEKEKPDVVVVTMGGNMIAGGATQADVTLQVSQIGNAVSASGAELIWVGPPKYDPQKRSPEMVENFYQKLGNIVPEFGTLIDSRPHIKEYVGNDGLHYTGPKGEKIAAQWAKGVFQEIQKLE